jgi:hypothetical protein
MRALLSSQIQAKWLIRRRSLWGNLSLGLTIAGLILAVAIGFAGGSAWMAVNAYNAHERLLQSWSSGLTFLTQNSYTARVLSPEQTAENVGTSLDVTSIRLAYVYDDLPQGTKDGIARYAKAARNIAIEQQGNGLMRDRRHLLIFADCLQKSQKTGGSVRECAEQNGMYGRNTADSRSNSPPASAIADAK